MTSIASPFLHSQPAPKRHKDTPSSPTPSFLTASLNSSPGLLSYPSPFYTSTSAPFAPLQSPFLSPLPPSTSHHLSTPSLLSLNSSLPPPPSTDIQLPPSALKPSPSSPTSLSSLSFYTSNFPFNAIPPILHSPTAMLSPDDDSDDEGGGALSTFRSMTHSHHWEGIGDSEGEGLSRPSSPTSMGSASPKKRGRGSKVKGGKGAKRGTKVKKVKVPLSPSLTSDHSTDSPSTPLSTAMSTVSCGSQPSPPPQPLTPAELAKEQTGGSGLSCHQCKTRKSLDELYTCGNHEKRKRAVGGEAKKAIKPCRKKYCARCLHKFYHEMPPQRTETGTTVLDFECPSCRLICQCAACRKRQSQADEAAQPTTPPRITPPPANNTTISTVKTAPVVEPPQQLSAAAVTICMGGGAVLHPAMQPLLDEAHGAPAMGTEVVVHREVHLEDRGEGEGETETEMSDGGAEDHSMGDSTAAA